MRVHLVYVGCAPAQAPDQYFYHGLTETGVAFDFYDSSYIKEEEIIIDDSTLLPYLQEGEWI